MVNTFKSFFNTEYRISHGLHLSVFNSLPTIMRSAYDGLEEWALTVATDAEVSKAIAESEKSITDDMCIALHNLEEFTTEEERASFRYLCETLIEDIRLAYIKYVRERKYSETF